MSILEITPGQLALEPCSGGLVITDPDSGDVLACVSYPGYDNNRLANTMDSAYYNQLNTGLANTFLQQSDTGKNRSRIYIQNGVGHRRLWKEGVIDANTTFYCDGNLYRGYTQSALLDLSQRTRLSERSRRQYRTPVMNSSINVGIQPWNGQQTATMTASKVWKPACKICIHVRTCGEIRCRDS